MKLAQLKEKEKLAGAAQFSIRTLSNLCLPWKKQGMGARLPLWTQGILPPKVALTWGSIFEREWREVSGVGVGRRPQRTSPAVSSWTVAPRTTYICDMALNLFGRGCQPRTLLTPSREARGRPAQSSVLVQSLSHVWLFSTSWTAAHQASLSITISRSLFKLMSIESVMPSNHLILCHPLLLHSIFPSIRVFSNESGGQSIGVSGSASVLPMNIQGWFPLELTGLLSSLSKGLSKVLSSTTVRKHQFFSAQLFFIVQLLQPYMTTGKNHSLV